MKYRNLIIFVSLFIFHLFCVSIIKNIELNTTLLFGIYVIIFLYSIFEYPISRYILQRYSSINVLAKKYFIEIIFNSIIFTIYLFIMRFIISLFIYEDTFIDSILIFQYICLFVNIMGIATTTVMEKIMHTKHLLLIIMFVLNFVFTLLNMNTLTFLFYPMFNVSLFSLFILTLFYSFIIYESKNIWEYLDERKILQNTY